MAKDDVIQIRDQWLELENLKFTGDVSMHDVEAVVVPSPIRVSLQIILPKGKEAAGFDYAKSPEVKKFRALLESKCVDALVLVAHAKKNDEDGDEDSFKEADSALKKLNAFVKKSTADFRVLLRTAVAKSMGDGTKADELMTVGAMSFKEFSLVPGAFEGEESFDSPLLDLSKALKRKKWQHCAVAWRASGPCFVSIRLKKEFKTSEIKELKDLLPNGSKKGTSGRVKAYSQLFLAFEFPEGDRPRAKILKRGLEEQLQKKGMKIENPIGVMEKETKKDKSGKKKNEREETTKETTKETKKETTKETTKQTTKQTTKETTKETTKQTKNGKNK